VSTLLVDLGAAFPMTVATTATVTTTVVTVVAQDPAPPPGRGPEFGKASPVGLIVVLVLFVATVALIRSMTVRIRRLPASFEPDPPAGSPRPAGPPPARDS